jgi:hypothetical protein
VGAAWAQRIANQQRFEASLAKRSEKLGLGATVAADPHGVDVDRRPRFTEHPPEVKLASRQVRRDSAFDHRHVELGRISRRLAPATQACICPPTV